MTQPEKIRIAVAGGTGLMGRHVVEAARNAGHDVVVIARAHGVDVTTGAGLDLGLAGVDAVVDVTNTRAADAAAARAFFGAATARLLDAGRRAGISHHVVLSIVGVDRVEANAHYAGKRRQEDLVRAGSVPMTIVRATQFHDFAGMVVAWNRRGDVATVPPLLLQPVAVADVAVVLVEAATGTPRGDVLEVAGPETQDLVDMARRTMAARGDSVRLVPSWRGGRFGVEMAGEVLLPGPNARIAPTSFETWLASDARRGSRAS